MQSFEYKYKGFTIWWAEAKKGWEILNLDKVKPTQAEAEAVVDNHLKVQFNRMEVYIGSGLFTGVLTSIADTLSYDKQPQYWVSGEHRGKYSQSELYPVNPENTELVKQINGRRLTIQELEKENKGLFNELVTIKPEDLKKKGE